MNRELPELPSSRPGENTEPEPESVQSATDTVPAEPQQDGPREAVLEPQSSNSPPPASPRQSGPPGMPAMPGEALGDGDDFDDDDFEIPEEVDYQEIVRTGSRGPRKSAGRRSKPIEGLIVGKRHDGVFVDIGQKSEAFLPIDPATEPDEPLEVGHSIEVVISGRSREGYPLLSSLSAQRPRGWLQLETAYNSGGTVLGKVIGTIKGGLSVDVGVRAFMPASRSGERTEEGLQALVGQEVKARIVQFDEADRNVVLDRRSVLEEERAKLREEALAKFNVGDRVNGIVRTLRKFGAFVDLGGIDGLLHVSDIAWQRVNDPSDMLRLGQELEVQILKVDRKAKRIGVGLKQLQPEPWSLVNEQIKADDRIKGKVVRIKDYGAFVEVIPGIEGLVHISDMSYARRVRHPSEIVKVGDVVEVMVLNVRAHERRIALGLKQALGDPWLRVGKEHPVNSAVIGTVRKITSFGAFVEIMEGVDALLHISDITSERRLNSPAEVLREGQRVRVKILEIDAARRRLKVGMKQLEPTELDLFLSQVDVGETVTGRVVKTQGGYAVVEIGNGVRGVCSTKESSNTGRKNVPLGQTSDLSSLKSMLESAWRGGPDSPSTAKQVPLTPGSVHSFKIKKLDAENGSIELSRA